MRWLWSAVPALVVACISSVPAQEQSVNRTASGQPNTDIRVGVYVNVRPDCTSGPLPSIQLTSPPENGKVTVKKAQVTATNYKQCLALEVPGFVAFYRSRADFAGVDVLTLEVKFPDGKTQVQRISVTVGTGSPRATHLNGSDRDPTTPAWTPCTGITRSALVAVSPGSSSRPQPCV
jgi:hypothetical protein